MESADVVQVSSFLTLNLFCLRAIIIDFEHLFVGWLGQWKNTRASCKLVHFEVFTQVAFHCLKLIMGTYECMKPVYN